MVAAYLLSGLVALWLVYLLCQTFAIVLFEPTLVRQWRKVWAAPVIRVRVTK
jgi:hypothetical protein